MQSLKNKTVLITGASSGIGESCAKSFAALGAKLILTARRIEKLESLANELAKEHGVEVLPLALDLTQKQQVLSSLESLPEAFVQIDILINNAGLALGNDPIHEGSCDDWDQVIDTNVKGLLYVTRACLPQMVARGEGHIINVGSIAGTEIAYPGGAIYCATKHAVHALSKSMRIDLHGKNIRVTEVDPGAVETPFTSVRWRGDVEGAKAFYERITALMPEDIADGVVYAATRRPECNVEQLILTHVGQASVNHLTGK